MAKKLMPSNLDKRKALIESYGFKYTRSCNCTGSFTAIYKRGQYEIHYSPKPDTFKFKQAGATLKLWTDAEKLSEYLQNKIPWLLIQ